MNERESYFDEEGEAVSKPEHLFEDPRIGENIDKAIVVVGKTNRESCFLASCDPETGEINVNDLYEGGERIIHSHMPGFGEEYTHPEGKGFNIKTDNLSFFIFHTHPHGDDTRASIKDLLEVFSQAKENFNLSSNDSTFWVNPVLAIANQDGSITAHQLNPQLVIDLGGQMNLVRKLSEACLRQLEELKDRNEEAAKKIDEEALESWRGNPEFMFGLITDESYDPVAGVPQALHENPEALQKAYEEVGIKTMNFKWENQQQLVRNLRNFQLAVEFKDV